MVIKLALPRSNKDLLLIIMFAYAQFCNVILSLDFADQWSPLNPEGKRQYDREFLLMLQSIPESCQRPQNLPEIPDIILDKVNSLFVAYCFQLYDEHLSWMFVHVLH